MTARVKSNTTFNDLPDNVHNIVASKLSQRDMLQFSETNKKASKGTAPLLKILEERQNEYEELKKKCGISFACIKFDHDEDDDEDDKDVDYPGLSIQLNQYGPAYMFYDFTKFFERPTHNIQILKNVIQVDVDADLLRTLVSYLISKLPMLELDDNHIFTDGIANYENMNTFDQETQSWDQVRKNVFREALKKLILTKTGFDRIDAMTRVKMYQYYKYSPKEGGSLDQYIKTDKLFKCKDGKERKLYQKGKSFYVKQMSDSKTMIYNKVKYKST
jgi:hypothetical protein